MHIEFFIEDSSGEKLLQALLPKILGNNGEIHTWRTHFYKGIGRIPLDLSNSTDPSKRILLDQLPRLLRGCGKTPSIDAVVIVVDTDGRNCRDFLRELKDVAKKCKAKPNTLFRLAIEEMEAWYFGDRPALCQAYPKAKLKILDSYTQDGVCNTWELLADAIYPGGSAAIKKAGWPLPGQIKHEWAEKIGPLMDPTTNSSSSFLKLRDGLQRLVAS